MASNIKNLSEYNDKNIQDTLKMKIGIVISEWNNEITTALYNGAYKILIKHGLKKINIMSFSVPGSFELPLGAKLLLENNKLDAVICLGCVIQGETRHFEFICNAVANGITNTGLKYGIPVIFGVLTTNTLQQAKDRAGGKYGNKGEEAAVSALKMASLKKRLSR